MAEKLTRRVKVGNEVREITLQPLDPEEMRVKKKEARLAALKELEKPTTKKASAKDATESK